MPACPNCGQDNPADARYCPFCGTRLQQATPAGAQERKVVTVLFCDQVGSTTRAEGSDPEDLRAGLTSYFNRLRTQIERHGGTSEKFIGDAVVAVFGAPVAHEDDPERAVLCGLAMLGAIQELNDEAPGGDMAVRIGISTGETLVLHKPEALGEGLVTGDVVNLAARLQEIAPVGSAVVTQATYRATRHLFDYEDLAPVQLKGMGQRVQVWRALGVGSRTAETSDSRGAAPFIDREDEMELIRRTFNRALHEPSVQLVTIVGEPGVGKSRLVREFAAYVDELPETIHWRQGRCLSYGDGITYWPLSEIVKTHAGILESDTADSVTEKLDAMILSQVEASERDWVRARLGPLVGVPLSDSSSPDSTEFHTAWRLFLEGVASERPLVLAIDDLHWGDLPMLAFIEHLLDWSTDVPLVVLCTARPELYDRSPAWGGGKRNSTTISLSPLGVEDSARLVNALLSEPMLSAESEAELIERAGGNPLYAEEFAQMVRDRTLPADFSFPPTLHSIIAARLDALPPELKVLLQDASVVGKVFWSGTLALMSGLDEQRVLDHLHELTHRELVRPARVSSLAEQDEFGFWHVLIRDVAYGQIPRAARAMKHRAVARWIEQLTSARASEHAELLVYHYGQALELASASGMRDETPQLQDDLLRSLLLAGERAMSLDVGRAARHYDRALELAPAGHADRGAVLAKAAQALARAGRFDEAERTFDEAVAAAGATGNARQVGDSMIGLASVLWHRGATARHRKTLDEGIRLLESGGPSPELTRAYAEEAITYAASGQLPEAVLGANRALEMANRLGLAGLRAQALAFRGGARGELGDVGGLDDLREALRLTTDLGLARESAQVRVIMAGVLWVTEGPRASFQALEAGIEVAERRGITDMAMAIRAESLGALFDLGEWERLLSMAGEVSRWSQAQGGGYFDVLVRIFTLRVELSRGVTRSSASVDPLLSTAREIGDAQVLVPGLAVAALHRQADGDLTGATRLIEEVDQVTRDRSDWYLVAFVPDLVRVCVASGRPDVAERLLDRMREPGVQRANSLMTGQALLAESAGQLDDASALFNRSAARWREHGFPFERGHSLFGEARCLTRLERPEALGRLREARSMFESLAAAPMLSELEVWVEQARAASTAGA